jgi:catechol 2,3-dioxygenase-like lactoylglutathione lyase family enzyme
MNVERPLSGIKETCIYVSDLDRTRVFYENALGLECFSLVKGSHAFFRAGYSVLLCFDPSASKAQKRLPRHFGSGELHFAFEVDRDRYDHWLKWIREKDIAIEHEHEWPGGFRSFYFRDPDRHCVEIIEMGMWEYGQDSE